MYVADAVQLLSYMRHTGTASSVLHGNENWISKTSDTSFLPIGRMVQTITNPTLGSINSCVFTQPRARSPAPKANATFRVLTVSSLTTPTAPGFYPLLCLSEPHFGTIPLMVPGGLEKSSNPIMSSDATSYGFSTTQALPWSTSQNPPMMRRSTPPVALGASKHMATLTRFKVSYMVNHLAFHAPSTVLPIRPISYLRPRRLCPRPRQVHLRPRRLCLRPSQVHLRPRRLRLRPRQVHLRPRRLYLRPRQLYLRRRRLCLQAKFYIYSSELLGIWIATLL